MWPLGPVHSVEVPKAAKAGVVLVHGCTGENRVFVFNLPTNAYKWSLQWYSHLFSACLVGLSPGLFLFVSE